MNLTNTIVQLEDPLNSSVENNEVIHKSRKTSKVTHKTKQQTKLNISGYQSDIDTPDDKKGSKPKRKILRKKRTPTLNVSNHIKLPIVGKIGKSPRLSKRVNFNKFLKNSSKTKKSTKRRLHNIENSLNIPSGYESDKEEESIINDMPKLQNMSLNNINIHNDLQSIQDNQIDTKYTSKSVAKSLVYHSKIQNGKLTEEGEYAINNNTKPYYIEGYIKDGKITEKMVRK